MAQTISVSQKELQRVASLSYEGKTLKVMLCNSQAGYTAESSVATWQSVEVSGNGYARGSVVIGTGSYSTIDGNYKLPQITVAYTGTLSGFAYNTVVLYIDGATYPHSIITESPAVIVQGGQTQTYLLNLITDD